MFKKRNIIVQAENASSKEHLPPMNKNANINKETTEEEEEEEEKVITLKKKMKLGTSFGNVQLLLSAENATEEEDAGSGLSKATQQEEKVIRGVTVDDDLIEYDNNGVKSKSKYGPTSAPRHIRATAIIDYKPDLCKDYNETGYCGFGDSCIYLHDRTNYLAGNQLDKKWEELQRSKKNQKSEKKKTDEEEEMKAFACFICRKPFESQPTVRTKCGHRFCKSCAYARFEKNSTCACCGVQTDGIFNDVKE